MIPANPSVRANALDALLSGLVDYAGLFPPASESMRKALSNYASYRAGDDRPALGRFIVPVSRLEELERVGNGLIARNNSGEPWPLAVLVAGDVGAATREMLAFNARHGEGSKRGRAVIDVAELKADTVEGLERQHAQLPPSITAYFEIPTRDDVSALVKAIARVGARAKIRTGGVTPESVPAAAEVIDFIAACKRESVPFKATAGLHHPVRGSYRLTYEDDSPIGTMYGFLNVFVAAALLYSGDTEQTAIAALEESGPDAFVFADDAIVWRDKRISAEQIDASRREFAISFGSCSFREPIDELKPLRQPVQPGGQ